MTAFAVAVHGGAADYRRAVIGAERAQAGLDAISASLLAAREVLAAGGLALDAVVAAVRVLEDAPVLNAGRGAALTTDGTAELDAAVADGRGRRFGAVTAVRAVRNPVDAARAVLVDGRHVLLTGDGAERLAFARGVARADPSWFVTEHQLSALAGAGPADRGTVGAVAVDAHGHVAAATSTGGKSGQLPGRVGDSPIVGAGTWADDGSLAISATGDGEAFLRAGFAHHVHLRVRDGVPLDAACAEALDEVGRMRGGGGCIAVTPAGKLVLRFTSPAMFRGYLRDGGEPVTGVEPDEC